MNTSNLDTNTSLAPFPSIKTHPSSPLMISQGPGIVSLREPMLLADGDHYFGVYCDHWNVHVAGVKFENQNEKVQSGTDLNNYTLIGYYRDHVVCSIPYKQIAGFSVCESIPKNVSNRKIFNLTSWWMNGGFKGQLQESLTTLEDGRSSITGSIEGSRTTSLTR